MDIEPSTISALDGGGESSNNSMDPLPAEVLLDLLQLSDPEPEQLLHLHSKPKPEQPISLVPKPEPDQAELIDPHFGPEHEQLVHLHSGTESEQHLLLHQSQSKNSELPSTKTVQEKLLPKILKDYFAAENMALRNLVKVRHIDALDTCPGSPNMQVAHIDGWVVIARSGVYRVGQMVVFVEIDSFIPDEKSGAFQGMDTTDTSLKKIMFMLTPGYLVRTINLNKQLSQGLVFPIEKVPLVHEVMQALETHLGSREDMECVVQTFRFANFLGVQKWEPQLPEIQPKGGRSPEPEFLGPLPPFLSETSASRVQNCPNLFTKSKYWRNEYQETIKMDGTSMTVYYVRKDSVNYRSCNTLPKHDGRQHAGSSLSGSSHGRGHSHMELEQGRFGVCSHRKEINEAAPGGSTYWKVALRYGLPDKLAKLGKNVAIQGELCGSSIGGNHEGLAKGEHDFFVFDIIDMDRRAHCDPRKTVDCARELGLPHVPIRGYFKIRQIASNHEDLYRRARETDREGLVYKCVQDGRRFKVANDEWLLRHGN